MYPHPSMITPLKSRILFLVSVLLFVGSLNAGQTAAASEEDAPATMILDTADFQGGLIVHVGCGDGELTAALSRDDNCLVHGLDSNPQNVDRARKNIRSAGLYGRVSVEQWDGDYLPYVDNLVNLLVVSEPNGIPRSELMRVLAPGGVLCVQRGSGWQTTTKPRPDEMDDWTHYLHDASGNAVANDSLVGAPKHLQWVADPLYCRSHEIDTSISALVSAGGRLFYIHDEGLLGITDERFPEEWALVARDAFNGVLLWKKPIESWGWRQWKEDELKGKDWTSIRGQRTRSPLALPRRLVSDGEHVFVTLGYEAPLTVLDAATGEAIRTVDETLGTDEILHIDGTLILSVIPPPIAAGERKSKDDSEPHLMAIEVDTGDILWKKPVDRLLPLSLAAGNGRIFFHDYDELVCLNLMTGDEEWRVPREIRNASLWGTHTTLVSYKDVVLFVSRERFDAFSAETGEPLWSGPGGRGPGVANPPDLFVADGLVWYGSPDNRYRTNDWLANPSIETHFQIKGYDPRSGEPRKTVDVHNIITPGHHFRCYRSKATNRYLLWTKRGIEFLDLQSDNHSRHDWLRATCKLGFMPCNGMIYMPPHQCFCYPGVKLDGFNALVSHRQQVESSGQGNRLRKGPAYGEPIATSRRTSADDWPMFRHDVTRSGSTGTMIPTEISEVWEVDLDGHITQPVVAAGKVFVANVDSHSVQALDAKNGAPLWDYTAGGRIDSPPVFHRGLLLFGSADGWVYCLRSSDGELVWRFRAAPEDRRVVSFGQLESVWPVHGSVLVKDDVAYFGAGRSSYLDGGIYVYGLDPDTGEKLYETCLEGPDPGYGRSINRPFDMDGTTSDVLVTDGTYLYMRQTVLDTSLNEVEAPRLSKLGERKWGRHIFATGGFLNDTWWNRIFWMYSERWPGYYIANQSPKAGQLLVFDESSTYGVKCYTTRNRHSPMFFPETNGYLLFADDNDTEPDLVGENGNPIPLQWLPPVNEAIGHRLKGPAVDKDKGTGFTRMRPTKWSQWVPIRMRAMVLAGDTLFVAGPPDKLVSNDPLAAFEGRTEGILWAVAAEEGTKILEYRLDSPPVFDGMIAANKRLYVSTMKGKVVCLGE